MARPAESPSLTGFDLAALALRVARGGLVPTPEVARSLLVTHATASRSTNRLRAAGLLDVDNALRPDAALVVLGDALRFYFPPEWTPLARGVRTAHAGPWALGTFVANDLVVWPCDEGDDLGQGLMPLFPTVPAAALADAAFWEVASAVEAVRAGRGRERAAALTFLASRARAPA
jgi:hypothetical protein